MTDLSGEVAALLAPVSGLGLPRPAYGGRSIVNVAVSAYRAAGGPEGGEPALAPPLDPALDPFGGRRAEGTVVVFLVDGLGWSTLAAWGATGSEAARRWAGRARPITTVFPTTTTAALASLSTGTAPAVHGLVGYRQYLPRFGVVADLLRMTPAGLPGGELLVGPHWTPADVAGAPTLFRRGLAATVVTRDRFKGTGFTRLLYDGAELVGYATATDLAEELRGVLDRSRPPAAVFLYWDELDTIQHLKGPTPALIALELEQVAGVIAHVAQRLAPERRRATTLLVTGDHGQVRAELAHRVAVDEIPSVVREMARPLAGDRRAGFLAARPGRAEALRRELEPHLPPGARVIGMREALEGGLFGGPPYHPEVHDRLGDLLVLVPSPAGLTYRVPGGAIPTRHLFGAHGGIEPEELIVPLLAGPLAAFAPEADDPPRKR